MGLPTHTSPLDRYKQEAQELMKQQDVLLRQLHGLEDELQTHGVGMDEPLIDQEGYPRADIDVAAIRHARNQVYRLRNDHKKVMADIETVLHSLHQAAASTEPSTTTTTTAPTTTVPSSSRPPLQPFAKVNAVSPDSPASDAGLQRNDLVLQFATITSENHQQLRALTGVVQTHLDRPLEIKVLRGDRQETLTLTPRNGWGGRGALGCHILPL
ncbi:hypothetical protein BC941DRAFT_406517 [Chlamydoabsidia padenii]|nr:hypothetical protein BC941DRAFT_406517 [Chlamydoabsidia padenii]